MRRLLFATGLGLGLTVSQAIAAQPQQDSGRFDVYFAGLKAGEVQFAMERDGDRYTARGRIKPSGLVDAFTELKIRAEVTGRLQGGAFQPDRYAAITGKGSAAPDRIITWHNGTLALQTTETPDAFWADPTDQRNTVDPLTALWGLLRRVNGDDPCAHDLSTFDGQRRMRLVTGAGQRTDKGVTCTGRYIREAGFSDETLEDGREFGVVLTYRPDATVWDLARIEVTTPRGPALFIRR